MRKFTLGILATITVVTAPALRAQDQDPAAMLSATSAPPATAIMPALTPETNAPLVTEPILPPLGKEPAAKEPAPPKPKPKAPPVPTFSGKLIELDRVLMTLTLDQKGKSYSFNITPRTRFYKDGKPAASEDGALDDDVTVTAKLLKGGKRDAITVRLTSQAPKAKATKTTKSAKPKSK